MAFTALRTGFDNIQQSISLIHRGLIFPYTARMAVYVGVNTLDSIVVNGENYLMFCLYNAGILDPDTLRGYWQ